MEADNKQKLQIAMAVATLIVLGNTARIFYERRQSDGPAKPAVVENRNLDDYVFLRPSHAHDLKSASAAISGKTVWVRNGNAITFFPYDRAGKRVDVAHAVGLLPPLEPLAVKSITMSGKAMLAVFERTRHGAESGAESGSAPASAPGAGSASSANAASAAGAASAASSAARSGEWFAAQIGFVRNGQSTLYLDDIFFLEDPHQLYKHWSAETWSAVERHEIVKGMSEIQASSAMGVGHPVSSSGDYGNRTLEFADSASGKTVTVTFSNNQAIAIER